MKREILALLLLFAAIVVGSGIFAYKHVRLVCVPHTGIWYYDPSLLPNLNGGWLL